MIPMKLAVELKLNVPTLVVFLVASLFQPLAYAQRLSESSVAKEGIFSFIEVNPADLVWGRYRVAHENFLFERISFAWNGEYQEKRTKGRFEEWNFGSGISLQYYPQSVSLQGPFFRAESNLSLSGVREDNSVKQSAGQGKLATIRMAGDLGWRVRLSDKLTGSAAYGLGTTLPQVLWTDNDILSRRWIGDSESMNVRVQINLGLLL